MKYQDFNVIEKTCSKCGESKPKEQFRIKKTKKLYCLYYMCRDCEKIAKAEYNKRNKDNIRVASKKYIEKNRDRMQEYKKNYRIENIDKIKKYNKEYKIKNRDGISKYNKEWKSNKKSYIVKYQKDYDKLYKKNKKETSVEYRLECLLRSRLKNALLNQNTRKSDKTLSLLGCTPLYLKNHLESQFTEGMTWDNQGLYGWHIDHIKPCCSFDLTDPKQQKKCFHYTNLQPLWAKDNLRKSNKLNWSPNE